MYPNKFGLPSICIFLNLLIVIICHVMQQPPSTLQNSQTNSKQRLEKSNRKAIMNSLFFFFLLLVLKLFSSVGLLAVVLGSLALYFINILWLKPQRLMWKLHRQGIKGPRPSFLHGNVKEMQKIQAKAMTAANFGEFVAHDYTSTLFPYFEQWRKEYGNILPLFFDYSAFIAHVCM